MKSIRSKVFETNSSSSHSLTCSKEVLAQSELIPKKYAECGKLPIDLKGYGWEYYRYYLFMDKVSYLATQLFNGQDDEYVQAYDVRESIDRGTDALAMLHRAVYNLTGCEVYYPVSGGFYIDHESVGVGSELYRDIKDLEEFLLNEASYIETGNDNSQAPWVIGTDKGMMDYYSQYYAEAQKDYPLLSFKKAEFKESMGKKISLFGRHGIALGWIYGKEVFHKIISQGVVEAIVVRESPDTTHYDSIEGRKGAAVKDVIDSLSFEDDDGKTISLKVAPDVEYQEVSDPKVEKWNDQVHFQVRVPLEVYEEYNKLQPADLRSIELDYCRSEIEDSKKNLNTALNSGDPSSYSEYYLNRIKALEEKIKTLESQ